MRTPVAAETQLEIILERIDPYYQPFLAFQDITSVTQLLQFCRKLDAKRDLAKDHVPPPPKHKSLIPEAMNIVPDLRQDVWHFSEQVPSVEVNSVRCETSLSASEKSALDKLVEVYLLCFFFAGRGTIIFPILTTSISTTCEWFGQGTGCFVLRVDPLTAQPLHLAAKDGSVVQFSWCCVRSISQKTS
ncbi:hypothetical protein NQ318_007512 [Aromia moschata]|uniref:Uncharacterized protein n=1 Tax=Aromia moschata TaxID=1265417 RepID=A0AAV8YEI4_9CUCU|nr:hypothetical protein NQ318_007512 [Aromia moschata]